MLEIVGAVGAAAALLALLGHIVVTLRAIHAEVRAIARRVEDMNRREADK